jgi:WD repeat-containing protein 90
MVFQINYHTHELEGVFQLHNAAIHSIALNEAFCVTGSSDNILRVWPLDFSEFFLEAKHEGTVTAIDITQDGIQVICGTEIGSIGLLDIAQQNYKTLLRSHTKGIRSLELHTNRNNLLTLSEDNTIRIWDLETYDEVYEFCSFEDKPLCLAAHPSLPLFACGFQSGTLRIFDIQRTTVVEEYRQFDKPLVKLKYAPNEGLLVCVAQDGYVCIHNAGKAHQPIKTVEVDVAVPFPALQFSFDQAIFLTVGSAGSSVNIWDSRVLATKAVVGIGAAIVKDLKFLNVNHDFVVLLHDNMIKFFTIQGNLLRKFNPGADLNTLTVSNNAMYLAASGNDAIVRIFDAQFPSNTEPDMQVNVLFNKI